MVRRIFIMLGNACNISCRYCVQHPLIKRPLDKEIDQALYSYLDEQFNKNKHLRVTFYGGEPLIYFPTIKSIVTTKPFLKGRAGIISNGKALSDEMVDFINKWDMTLTISWDGKESAKTRKFNVMEQPEIRHRLMRVNKLCLSGVLSSCNSLIGLLNDFNNFNKIYFGINEKNISINVDPIFDTGLADKRLINVDYEKVREEIRYLYNLFIKKDFSNYCYTNYIYQLLHRMKKHIDNINERNNRECSCSNGYSVMNVDLKGNLYQCHNTSEIFGHVSDTDISSYVRKIVNADVTEERRKTICQNCQAKLLCDGGCKLVPDENLKEYCRLRKAIYGTLFECVTVIRGDIC